MLQDARSQTPATASRSVRLTRRNPLRVRSAGEVVGVVGPGGSTAGALALGEGDDVGPALVVGAPGVGAGPLGAGALGAGELGDGADDT